MRCTREFYMEENKIVMENYEKGLKRIGEICIETEKSSGMSNFFNVTGKFILKLAEIERQCGEDYIASKSLDELQRDNLDLYDELMGDNYKTSFANPAYAVEVLGDNIGQLLSAFYTKIRKGISCAMKNRLADLEDNNKTFIEIYEFVRAGRPAYEDLKNIITRSIKDRQNLLRESRQNIEERYDPGFGFYRSIVMSSDLNDLRYLFNYDLYISEDEIKLAQFLMDYPEEKIVRLAKSAAEAFIRGFIIENKDKGDRNVVRLFYSAGLERIIRQLVMEFKEHGFECSFQRVTSTNPNKQYGYDHRFDNAIYLDEEFARNDEEAYDEGHKLTKGLLDMTLGPMLFETFGEKPFSPDNKKECLKLSKEQEELQRSHDNILNEIYYRYEPNEKTSFSIIALPSPQIGEKFKEIFEDTLEINMMDNESHERIQQSIIDALDKGDYAHIAGMNGNKTDIKVKLHEIKDPDKETNFVNCVADVNIPLGEVYSTPQLKGTNGVLHLKDTYLGLKYKDLRLVFEDGCVADYGCSNFDNEKENKDYVKENLLEFHDGLPIGEFAIGTNTKAYVMAQKYGIIEVLPILIIEKMGPHFAIGDTCFSWSEDLPVYNILNKKEIVARDNERSILRKQDINKAYTGVHTDITIPYEEIGYITVVTKNGEKIDIIRDGRFVLNGTEELNKAFEK